ncbi:outer membrane beta-barrel protein [Mucilaginibacter rubeus]|uniref:PorT family protein n=1 Tax=Mucilaginibacter rubeus TaxID=2027860 RepID=A0A5C1I291_9SPHI|nr:outer membrane beta-barrel protein [Mucilaginibacter rubeus]QEM12045.1 PorT family protein [Mucilaginibacter rubeus]
MTNKPIRITFILLFTVFSFAAKAQRGKQTSLSIGSGIIAPLNMNNRNDSGTDININSGFSINLTMEKPITETLHFTAATGLVFTESNADYLFSSSSSNVFYDNSYHNLYVYLPVTAGLKYYWAKHFYVNAEAGSAFSINSRARTSFIYAGGAGAVVPIGPHHGLDFGLQFERGYKNTDYDHAISQLVLNVAYKYRF